MFNLTSLHHWLLFGHGSLMILVSCVDRGQRPSPELPAVVWRSGAETQQGNHNNQKTYKDIAICKKPCISHTYRSIGGGTHQTIAMGSVLMVIQLCSFSKVYISKEGTVAEYGMLAKEDIDEGELLFTIPRMALLHQGTTKVLAVLEEGETATHTHTHTSCLRPPKKTSVPP